MYICQKCGQSFKRYSSLQKYCNKCIHNTYAKKPIRKVGPVTKQWFEAREKWIDQNPANHQGYWFCYYCGNFLTINTLTLDHKEARSRKPDKRFDLNNLVPCCAACNGAKGSLSAEEYSNKIHSLRPELGV